MRAATRRRIAVPAAITSGILLSGLLVWHTSYAAFTKTTTNPGNSFTAGNVDITNDRAGNYVFSVSNLVPGSTGHQCVAVTYNGNVTTSTVNLAAAYTTGNAASNPLAQYLDFNIEEVGDRTNCDAATGGTSTARVPANSTLASIVTTAPTLGWSNPANGAVKYYRFTYTLQSSTPNASQGDAAGVGFTWTAST